MKQRVSFWQMAGAALGLLLGIGAVFLLLTFFPPHIPFSGTLLPELMASLVDLFLIL